MRDVAAYHAAAEQVVAAAQAAIAGQGPVTGHPDDATLLLYRPGARE